MAASQTSEFPTWEWAKTGAAANSIADAWHPFSERLSALGFDVSALIYDAPPDRKFPSRSELFGTLISEEYVEYCRNHTTDDFRFRVPAASMQGRQTLIEPERILAAPLSKQARSLVARMADFGL
ncbi:MAG: hypothetical protein U5Q16_04560, partial [Gammaproteobacteria bacterium]|nr:hypothetical protein [Gammaproteobacteria bacterium]